MQNIELDKWYTKDEILEILPIGITTYKKRIKTLESPLYSGYTKMILKEINNSNLKNINKRLIKGDAIPLIFGDIRMPSLYDRKNVSKWIKLLEWDWFCNVIPTKCYPIELKAKMKFIYERLKIINGRKNELNLFYSIETNTSDPFFHCHFLIRSSNKNITYNELIYNLNDIAEENTYKEKRIYVEPYDYERHGSKGVSYSDKHSSIDYGFLK